MTRAFRSLAQSLGRTWVIAAFGLRLSRFAARDPRDARACEFRDAAAAVLRVFRGADARDPSRLGGERRDQAYRAHFRLDDFHWIWYAGLFTALLGRLFERRAVSHRFDWILLLPLASGLLDLLENQIQRVFLGAPGFLAVVDPLPLISTAASILKWGLALVYLSATAVLLWRVRSETASSSLLA